MMQYQPLAQFEIIFLSFYKNIIPINNALIYMFFVYIIIRILFGMVFVSRKIIPNN